jgi:hypothetical protein
MQHKILGLIEDNIATKLLLATRLQALGCQITILSSPAAFKKQVELDDFDWILLDEAALPPVRQRFLDHLQRHRRAARLVWCGKTPRRMSVPIEVTFAKPLRYSEITGFFTRWMPPGRELVEQGARQSGEGAAREAKAGAPPSDARGMPVICSDKRGKKPCVRRRS